MTIIISAKRKLRPLKACFYKCNTPKLFIVGAQKAGTSSLHNYLSLVPGLSGSKPKEVHFFDREENYRKGLRWYKRHFLGDPYCVHFESSPEYLYRKPVPPRINRFFPEAKIVIVLREPIARALSAYNMYHDLASRSEVPRNILVSPEGKKKQGAIYNTFFKGSIPTFSEYVDYELSILEEKDPPEEPGLIRRGFYDLQVERYLAHFDVGNILIVGFNELKESPSSVIERICQMVGVECPNLSHTFPRENMRRYHIDIDAACHNKLEQVYRPHNERLKNLIGMVDW